MLNWIKSIKKKISLPKQAGKASHTARGGGENKKKVKRKRANSSKNKTKNATASITAKNLVSHKVVVLGRAEHTISRDNIDDHALKVLYRLHKAGYHACLVGGAVRDLLLGIIPKDFDVATDATPEQVNQLFRNCRLIGRRFRLAHIHFGRQIIEVATYRANHDLTQSGVQDSIQDGIQDKHGRIVRDNVFGELADDVWRRDFTANALYYDISDFSVIDFVGGYNDIKNKQLCLIGDAETRYREDPVRMLRALRFSAKLGFEIDALSKTPVYELGVLLKDIPAARLYEEVVKLFHSGYAVRSFEMLLEFNLLQYLFPEADKAIKQDDDVKNMLLIAMKNTDKRIRNSMRVTPAFLLAAFLWQPVNSRTKSIVEQGIPYSVAIQKAATKILSQQVKSVSIPRRFTSTMRDIWGLQTRFHYRTGKRALSVLQHEKFRAGYDFLCIRAQAEEGDVGDSLKQDCKWWTDIQEQTAEQQKQTLYATQKKRSGKNTKRRRSPAAKKTE